LPKFIFSIPYLLLCTHSFKQIFYLQIPFEEICEWIVIAADHLNILTSLLLWWYFMQRLDNCFEENISSLTSVILKHFIVQELCQRIDCFFQKKISFVHLSSNLIWYIESLIWTRHQRNNVWNINFKIYESLIESLFVRR
jgi:hypothetical protein